jgi:DNA gyrase subunit B
MLDTDLVSEKDTYSAKDIIYKEGAEGIQQNAAMYIGDTSYGGFHHLASEVIDNSIDEVLAEYASKVIISLHKDGSCSVEDDGRGIPAEPHPEHKISTLEIILTRMHSSGKYEKTAYKKYSAGIHGLGLKACNALSEWLEVVVQREGKKYSQKYFDGKPSKPVEVIGESKSHGTSIRFKPSKKIFRDVKEFDANWFAKRLRDLAYLNPGVELIFNDLRADPPTKTAYLQKRGLLDYVDTLLSGADALLKEHFQISVAEPDGIVRDDGSQDEMKIALAMNYCDSDTELVLGFTNNVFNRDGGTHIVGFQTALTSCLNNYLKKNFDLLSKQEQKVLGGKNLRGEDYRQGLVAVVSIKLRRPQFSNQAKDRLTNVETQGAVRTAVSQALNKWIEENPASAKKVLEKAILNFRAHLASKQAAETVKKDNKSLLGGNKKLKDCTEEDPEKTELFIVEGDSAGGSAVNGRDPSYQAVLALGGKILNTWRATPSKMLAHEEISSLIKSLGTGILDGFDADKCRYNKIIIMCDADVDGLHIRTLLLTFLFQRMRKLIEQGKVYIAQPPLYRVQHLYKDTKCQQCGGGSKKASSCGNCTGTGKAQQYITYDSEFYSTMSQFGSENALLVDHQNSAVLSGDKLQAIIAAAKDKDAATLQGLGFKLEDILPPKLHPGDIALTKYTIKNDTKAKEVSLTYLLQLPESLVQLGQNCVDVGRFKGLGEMSSTQIWITTMDPTTRSLLQITLEDVVEAHNKFEVLMGTKAEARRDFIIGKKAY